MLSSKKFTANLQSIRKADDVFRGLIAECLAFAIYHARNHGQKTPYMQLCEAAPGWLKKGLDSVPVSKVAAKRQITEGEAENEASFRVAEWFASHAEQKAIRNANRKARVATPKPESKSEEPVQPVESDDDYISVNPVTEIQTDCALIVDCQVVEITEQEATLLAAYLQQLRQPALRVA